MTPEERNKYYRDWRKKNSKKYQQYTRDRYAKNPERHRGFSLKCKYGISLAQYDEMFRAQHGVCGVCGNAQTQKRLAVDHCHGTGKIRGLLCDACNRALGYAQESPEILRRMIDYLGRYRSCNHGS